MKATRRTTNVIVRRPASQTSTVVRTRKIVLEGNFETRSEYMEREGARIGAIFMAQEAAALAAMEAEWADTQDDIW